MGTPTSVRGGVLPDAKAIMSIMRVPMVERLCEVVMGWILALECMWPGTRGCLRPCTIVLDI
jgi:hypothetical protein